MEALLTFTRNLYLRLPTGGKRFINDVAPYSDMAIWTIGMTLLLSTPHLTPKKSSIAYLLIASFLFLLTGVALYWYASKMAMGQISVRYDEEGEDFDRDNFLPAFPLDLTFGNTPESIAQFAVDLGAYGREAFTTYLWIDSLVAIPLYTFVHLHAMAYFYPDDDSMAYLTSKLPWVLGAFDLYENVGYLMILALGGKPSKLSENYLGRVLSANVTKFGLFWIILGLEFAGVIKKMLGDVDKKIAESKEKGASKAEEKKAEERRKKRLEKKVNKAE
ncbi:hypothetical protein HDU96_001291 [Phlyctochytrium bullatum]|nr:hypothetical protein HDU96_001291 [Phlyctochytrium bullatum]